jgi:hypothetical protein
MADGPLLPSLNAAKAMLRDCYWWRRIISEASPMTEEQAAARIYFDELPPASPGPDHTRDQLVALRPFCLLWADVAAGFRMRFDATGSCCVPVSGTFVFRIELPVPNDLAANPTGLAIDMNRKLGRLLRTCDDDEPGLAELTMLAGYLPIKELSLRGYVRTDAKTAIELGDAVVAEIEMQWGND